MSRALKPCGTVAAYERHRRADEEICDACREAKRVYSLETYIPHPRKLQPCGTVGAYQRHLYRGEETCQPCRDAISALKAKAPRNPPACGTTAAYHVHREHGEKPCEPCRLAHNAYLRDYRAKRARRDMLDQLLAEVLAEVTEAA